MESLFRNRGLNVTVSLRNNHGTYLAASDHEKSLTLVTPTRLGFIPKNAEWTIKFHSATSQFTEFGLWSVYGKELVIQKGGKGEIVVCQQNPNYSRPFCWRIDNSQPLTGGIYLLCDCESGDWVSELYKLSATQDGTIMAKPSFDDTWLDPGSWWFIEVAEKSTSEIASVSKQASETGSTSSDLCQPLARHHQFTDMEQQEQQDSTLISPFHDQDGFITRYAWGNTGPSYQFHAGMNSNGSGNQNIGDVKIKNKISVSNAGHGMTPNYNHEGPYVGFGNSPLEMYDEQLPYDPADQNMGNELHTTATSPFSGAPSISTYINAGNNSNGSGTQTNNFSIKNKGPIYKNW